MTTLHNPFTSNGLLRIKKTVLASGPAAAKFPESHRRKEPQARRGWRFGSFVARYAVGSCLAINVLFLIIACTVSHVTDGIGVLYTGDCGKTRTVDTWVHVMINGLATALVGASNYTMQCLVAPNRSEVDAAHAKGVWLDVGVPSVRNLRHIAWRRVALWFFLAISTIPIHLMWNSVIFSTIQDNSYVVVGASASILQDSQFDCKAGSFNLTLLNFSFGNDYDDVVCDMFNDARVSTEAKTPLVMLDTKECMQQYGTNIQSKWSNVIVVVDHVAFNSSCGVEPLPSDATQLFAFEAEGRFWHDGHECSSLDRTTSASLIQPDEPLIYNYAEGGLYLEDFPQYPVKYCLATEGLKSCRLEYSLPILLIVIFCNAIKLSAIIYAAKTIKKDHFITLGDAVASFLEVPDKTTVGHCLGTRSYFQRRHPRLEKYDPLSLVLRTRDAETGKPLRVFWFKAPSLKRWFFILAL